MRRRNDPASEGAMLLLQESWCSCRKLDAPAARKLDAPAARRLDAPALKRRDAPAARKLDASAASRLIETPSVFWHS